MLIRQSLRSLSLEALFKMNKKKKKGNIKRQKIRLDQNFFNLYSLRALNQRSAHAAVKKKKKKKLRLRSQATPSSPWDISTRHRLVSFYHSEAGSLPSFPEGLQQSQTAFLETSSPPGQFNGTQAP